MTGHSLLRFPTNRPGTWQVQPPCGNTETRPCFPPITDEVSITTEVMWAQVPWELSWKAPSRSSSGPGALWGAASKTSYLGARSSPQRWVSGCLVPDPENPVPFTSQGNPEQHLHAQIFWKQCQARGQPYSRLHKS